MVVGASDSATGSMSSDEYKEALREAMVAARVNLAANDLVGKGWGKAGAFRKALHAQLRAAKNTGYSPVDDRLLTSYEPASFLEQGFLDAAEKHRLHADIAAEVTDGVDSSIRSPVHLEHIDVLAGGHRIRVVARH